MATENIALLFDWGNPSNKNYDKRDWGDYLQYGFSQADESGLIELLIDKKFHDALPESNDIWVPLYAWRILGELRSKNAIEPLISIFDILSDDDWAFSEVPVVMGMIGEPAIAPLCCYLREHQHDEFARVIASDGIVEIAKQHPELRGEVVSQLSEYLAVANPVDFNLNGLLVCGLIDLKAVEAIDEIRSVYLKEYVDITIAGDLEDVEIALGIRHKRETPKPHYGISGMPDISGLLGIEGLGESRALSEKTYFRDTKKIGRNDPCICGSGKKYKRCCLN